MSDVSAMWKELGIQLQLNVAELHKISANVAGYDSISEYCFSRVVNAWLDGNPTYVTRMVLADAVKVIGHGQLAEELKSESGGMHNQLKLYFYLFVSAFITLQF